MRVWVTRDKDKAGVICMWGRKPFDEIDPDGTWQDTIKPIDEDENARNFKKNFGFTPRKGSCDEYELTLTKITPKCKRCGKESSMPFHTCKEKKHEND